MDERHPFAYPRLNRALALVLSFSAACTGAIDGVGTSGRGAANEPPDSPNGDPASEPRTDEILPPAPAGATAGEVRLLRLTKEQWINTLNDLVGDSGGAVDLPFDSPGESGFYDPNSVGSLEARRIKDIAEKAAAKATANLTALMGCDPAVAARESGCVDAFIGSFGKRAFRRPLVAEDTAAVRGQYDSLRAGGLSPAEAIRVVVSTILQAPSFLYRWELGSRAASVKGGLVSLNPYEIASRLSYLVWSSMPDQELFAAADARTLLEPAEIARQARRMLASDKAQNTIATFHNQWLGLGLSVEKDPIKFPSFTADLRSAMDAETKAFLRFVFSPAGDGKLETLFGANFSFINEPLAKLYGVTGVKGTALTRTTLDAKQRFGLLTQGHVLSIYAHPDDTNPVKRGMLVRERLLCQPMPSPPMNVKIERPVPDPKVTVREQFAQHSSDPACSGCHALMDPLGFAFENYDAIGTYRTKANGKTVDAGGVATRMDGRDKPFANLEDLAGLLRGSPEARRCVTSQWLRFALGRKDVAGDKPSADAAYAAFERAGFDVRELIVALAESPSFRFRTPSLGEVTQ